MGGGGKKSADVHRDLETNGINLHWFEELPYTSTCNHNLLNNNEDILPLVVKAEEEFSLLVTQLPLQRHANVKR